MEDYWHKAGLFVSVKRVVSRGLKGKEFEEKLALKIAEACDDLLKQAAHLFLQPENEDQDSVLAIAAADELIHLHIYLLPTMTPIHRPVLVQYDNYSRSRQEPYAPFLINGSYL
jgi:hypothetical protein